MKMLEMFQNRYKVIAVMFFVFGIAVATAYGARGGVENEVENFAQSIIKILTGGIGKVLALAAFLGCGISLFSGRYGGFLSRFLAGILFGFAKPLAEAVFR